MGTISKYAQLLDNKLVMQPQVVKTFDEVFAGKPILSDAKEVTLAEYDVETKNAITAHHIKDYRRKKFNLILLPNIDIMFDRLLEGSGYWNELLHHESSYS